MRLFRVAIAALSLVASACVINPPPVVVPPHPPAQVRTVGASFSGVDTPLVVLSVDNGDQPPCDFDAHLHLLCTLPASTPAPFGATLDVFAPNYTSVRLRFVLGEWVESGHTQGFDLTHTHQELPVTLALQPAHFDPSRVPLEQIARIRGAMWSVRMNLPFGPRPNRDDNILAVEFFYLYPPETQKAMLARYTAKGYWSAPYGPTQGNDCYHGLWPCSPVPRMTQDLWDRTLDQLQTLWDNGIEPIYFAHRDNASVDDTIAEMTPFLQQPRAQQLIRALAPFGWEPNGGIYDISSCSWTKMAKWAHETMPNALILLHNAVKADGAPADAFVGSDSLCDDEHGPSPIHIPGGGADIPAAWRLLQPYVHGWLIQSGPRTGAPDPARDREWISMFNSGSLGFEFHSIAAHLRGGMAGWPRGSAFPDNRPMLLCDGEKRAYTQFWGNEPETWAEIDGDHAMANGADCYLDGGTVPVGNGPVPWQVH